MDLPNLTRCERTALAATYNLADGHARSKSRLSTASIERVLASMSEKPRDQKFFDQRFLHAFGKLLGQGWGGDQTGRCILPSASASLEVMANVLRLQGADVLAPEPCFDNLVSILKRHKVRVTPYDGNPTDLRRRLRDHRHRSNPTAVLLVSPGNPLGTLGDADSLRTAIGACVEAGASVLLDASFRAYSKSLCRTDTYAVLVGSGVSFLACEDTGKFLPTYELKASPLIFDRSMEHLVSLVYDDFMIGHSPFILELLTDIIQTYGDDLIADARSLVTANRTTLTSITASAFRDLTKTPTSVAWLETVSGEPSLRYITNWKDLGIHVLPGEPFYWSGPNAAAYSKARVALMRDRTYFADGVRRIASASDGRHA